MNFSRKLRARRRLWRTRWRRLDLTALRLFIKFIPSERQRVFALTVIIGALCGLAAVAFHLAIRFAERYLIESAMSAPGHSWIALTLITPTAGGLLSGALLQYVVPNARGSGIPQVKVAYAIKGGRLSFTHSTLGKFIIGTIQIGTGASLGREGPTVQICAGIASLLGRAAALSKQNMRKLLPVGAAAGIAAAFNAPIAAVTFTIEEVVGDLDQTVLSGVIVAAALAAVIERSILGEHPVFEVPQGYGLHHASSLIFYALLGIFAAVVAVIFTESLLKLRWRFQRLSIVPAWMRPSIGGLVTGAMAVLALLWLKTGGVTGGGYETLSQALSGTLAVKVLIALCVMKLIATVFSYSSGGAGGIFAPALFIGGTLGGAIGFLDVALLHHPADEVGAFALVGMGAVFAGIIRAPITSILIIFEMTGSYALILPLMISNMTAYALARRFRPVPIYEALLEQDGIHLPHREGAVTHALEQLRVADAMTGNPVTLPAGTTVAEAVGRINDKFSTFPVVAEGERFVGFVTEARLRLTLAEDGGERTLRQLIGTGHTIFPDQKLTRAVVRLNQTGARQLAVIARDGAARLIGLLTLSDIVRAHAQAVLGAEEIQQTFAPEMATNSELINDDFENALIRSP